MQAFISDIKRFAVHDGPGIRTTVFLKGCPLKCVWCHNPEGLSFKPQLAYYHNTCIHCGACVDACSAGAHSIRNGLHTFSREGCAACGNCAENCLGGALRFYGRSMDAEQLLPLLLEDSDFYETSGGGVTLSGGECLSQPDFCVELLQKLKEQGIHTAVDTCGYVPRESIDKVLPYTDLFLYDIKAIEEDVHIQCTGRSNRLILQNLQYLDSCGKDIAIRIPYVPAYNHSQMKKIAGFVKTVRHVTSVTVLPYHNYASSKYEALGLENTLPGILPTDEQMEKVERLFL